jgi:hypothetical protein
MVTHLILFSAGAFVYEEEMPDAVVLKIMKSGGQTLYQETQINGNLS